MQNVGVAMLAVSKVGLTSSLNRGLDSNSEFLPLHADVLSAWIPADGTYYYATISNHTRREHVMVTGYISGKGLVIKRGVDSTTPQNFPVGSCVKVEWNPQQLLDFLSGRQLVQPQIKKGVYCLSCNTCITVEADGTISNIQDSLKCSNP